MDGDGTGTKGPGTAHVHSERAGVDGGAAADGVRRRLDTPDALRAQAVLNEGEAGAQLVAQDTVEREVVARLGADDEHGFGGAGGHGGLDVLDNRELVGRRRNQTADDLGGPSKVKLTVVDAVGEGDDARRRKLLPALGSPADGIIREGHHHVGDTGADREVAAQSGGEVRVIGRSGEDERARLDGEVRHVGVISLQGHDAVVRQGRTIVERADGQARARNLTEVGQVGDEGNGRAGGVRRSGGIRKREDVAVDGLDVGRSVEVRHRDQHADLDARGVDDGQRGGIRVRRAGARGHHVHRPDSRRCRQCDTAVRVERIGQGGEVGHERAGREERAAIERDGIRGEATRGRP